MGRTAISTDEPRRYDLPGGGWISDMAPEGMTDYITDSASAHAEFICKGLLRNIQYAVALSDLYYLGLGKLGHAVAGAPRLIKSVASSPFITCVSALGHHISIIVKVGAEKQVSGPHAAPCIAGMAHQFSARVNAVGKLVRGPVRQLGSAVRAGRNAVARGAYTASPEPAITGEINARPEMGVAFYIGPVIRRR